MIKINNYETLLMEADREGLIAKEKPLLANDGRILGNRIAIRADIPTQAEKACVMAEELGHYYTSSGDIIDQSIITNRKQEARARLWAFDKLIGLHGLINAYNHRCRSLHETAEYLNVTEQFLREALEVYHRKYGVCTAVNNYIIYFEPNLIIAELNCI